MAEDGTYPSPAAVDRAIKDAAKRAHSADKSISTSTRIRLEYFRRFLSRIFATPSGDRWLLKGGTGMLARVASTRATKDVDLLASASDLNVALEELRTLADIDLGDHFRFVYVGHDSSIGEQQPYADGYQVHFEVYIGAMGKGRMNVDLVVAGPVVGDPTVGPPANALDLPKLVSHDYRIYPVVDQVADKVCATLATYNGNASGREKDLVDLVVLAVTQQINGTELTVAIAAEVARRRLDLGNAFAVPGGWGIGYARQARDVPHCAKYRAVAEAAKLVAELVDPAMGGTARNKTWQPDSRAWI